MAKQLIDPDVEISETAGMCLQYARRVFGLPAVEDSAWEAWVNTRYKHKDKEFPQGIAVPVWFDWTGNIKWSDGVWRTQRYGHAAVRTADGKIWSSPLSGKGRAWFASVDDLSRAFGNGMKYVGWSEDISNVRIMEGRDEVITRENFIQGAQAAGFGWGEHFNYDPDMPLDLFVQLLDGNAPRITRAMENDVADSITGVKSVVGWDGYNSKFVGQKVATHYPAMVEFWITQRPTQKPVGVPILKPGVYEVK